MDMQQYKGKGLRIFTELLGCLIVGIIIVVCIQRCRKVTNDYEGLRNVVKLDKQDSTSHYRDLYNREHATRQEVEADRATIELLYGQLLDSVSTATGAKRKNIQSVTAFSSQTSQTITPEVKTIYLPDSSSALEISYSDKWLWLKGTLGREPVLTYSIYDSIIISTHYKRKNIFAPKEVFVDAYSLNPHTRVNQVSSIRIAPGRAKRWGIGPYAGYGWNGVQWAPSLGISVQYSIIRL